MRIALWQTSSLKADPTGNIARLRPTARAAKEAGASLLLCPDLWLCGYNHPELIPGCGESQQGPAARQIAEIARAHGLAIAYGYPERAETGALYNAAQVIGPDGVPLAHYRKTHLYGAMERSLFTPGDDLGQPVAFGEWRIALLICYDVEFPETVRSLALEGATLILAPTAVGADGAFVGRQLVPARAIESQLHLAYANHCGSEGSLIYGGESCVAAPDGTVVRAGSDEGLLTADLDDASRRRMAQRVPYLTDRRPALYGQKKGRC